MLLMDEVNIRSQLLVWSNDHNLENYNKVKLRGKGSWLMKLLWQEHNS